MPGDPTSIPGVTVFAGMLNIRATRPGGNLVVVDVNPSTGNLRVTVNDETEEFELSEIWTVSYDGQLGGTGGDTFTNNSALTETLQMRGGRNTVIGGKMWNMVNLRGDNNVFDSRGVPAYVYSYAGPNDHIVPYPEVKVTRFAIDPEA